MTSDKMERMDSLLFPCLKNVKSCQLQVSNSALRMQAWSLNMVILWQYKTQSQVLSNCGSMIMMQSLKILQLISMKVSFLADYGNLFYVFLDLACFCLLTFLCSFKSIMSLIINPFLVCMSARKIY